jgi:hypothetical protein
VNRRNCKVKIIQWRKKESVDDPKIYKHPEIKIFICFVYNIGGKIEERNSS